MLLQLPRVKAHIPALQHRLATLLRGELCACRQILAAKFLLRVPHDRCQKLTTDRCFSAIFGCSERSA